MLAISLCGLEGDERCVAAVEAPHDRLPRVPFDELRQCILYWVVALQAKRPEAIALWWRGLTRRPRRAVRSKQLRARGTGRPPRHPLMEGAPRGADGARAGDGVE